jgi:hypothetical protein
MQRSFAAGQKDGASEARAALEGTLIGEFVGRVIPERRGVVEGET